MKRATETGRLRAGVARRAEGPGPADWSDTASPGSGAEVADQTSRHASVHRTRRARSELPMAQGAPRRIRPVLGSVRSGVGRAAEAPAGRPVRDGRAASD